MNTARNMGDLDAAKKFQEQVRRGGLDSGRSGRATRGAGPQMSPSFATTSHVDRDSSRRPAGDVANVTAGNWASRLATAPPSHLFNNGDIAKSQSSQPTPADDRGEPMVVDDEFDKPQTSWSNSRWGGGTNNVTDNTLGFDGSTESRPGAVEDTMKAVPLPGPPVRGLGASNWNRPTSTAAPSAPVDRPAVAPDRDVGGSEKAQPAHSPKGRKGLVNSIWASGAKPMSQVKVNGKVTVMNTVFGKDTGPVVDPNWIYTYHVEDGGRLYNLAARKAQDAGDRVAALSLSNVAELSAEVVRARILLHDGQAEKKARDAANRAAELAADAFDKYHPPLPEKVIVEDTTFHSIQERIGGSDDAQSIRTSIVPQPSAPDSVGHVLAEAVQPAGVSVAVDPHSDLSRDDNHAMNDARPGTQQSVAGGRENNQARGVSKQQSSQQAQTHQQPETVQQPTIDLQSIPTNFDDPRARQMLEDFFFARGTN